METYWIDADNKKHEIVEMSDKYIKNCIKQIKIAVQNNAGKSLEYIERYDEDKVLSPKWTKERAQSYLDTFNDELEIRDRIKKSDFPKIPKSYESCQ